MITLLQKKRTWEKQERVGDFVVVDVETHKEMHNNMQQMQKTARVVLRRGRGRQQVEGLKIINQTLKKITNAVSRDEVHVQAGIATGYANAMQNVGLMSEDELIDIVDVIEQAGERALFRVKIQDWDGHSLVFQPRFREEESHEHTENRK